MPAARSASRMSSPVRARPAARPLADLPNLGPRSAQMLAAAGITSLAQLKRVGAVAAYARVRRVTPAASLNLLYALAGALDGEHWQTVKRQRKLALVTALEDVERARARPAHKTPAAKSGSEALLALRNIGPAMRRDFDLLGICSLRQLARADADRLYLRLQQRTHARHDPCVWDTFAAAIHQARGGEALPWWHFTRERKRREAEGSFPPRFVPRVVPPALVLTTRDRGAPAQAAPEACERRRDRRRDRWRRRRREKCI